MPLAAYSIRYDLAGGPPRKIEFHPSERPDTEYIRVVREWNGCQWRTVGREPVDDVVVTGELQANRTVTGP